MRAHVDFVLAGNAYFTVSNNQGGHYTFRVRASEDGSRRYFAQVLIGPDNTNDYVYLGMVVPQSGNVRLTRASRMPEDSKPVRVLRWALARLWAGADFPPGYACDVAGRCGRCGRPLTHPDGVADDGYRLGFGPHCWKQLQSA